MLLRKLPGSEKQILITSLLIFSIGCIVVFLFGFKGILDFIDRILRPYSLLIQFICNKFFQFTGHNINLIDNKVYSKGIVFDYEPQILFKKIFLGGFLLIWLTASKISAKFYFTFLLLLLHLFVASTYVITGILHISEGLSEKFQGSLTAIAFCMVGIVLLFWYWLNKYAWNTTNKKLLEKKFTEIITVIFGYSIIIFLLEFLKFKYWIAFLFGTSKLILQILGYNVILKPSLLIGDNGSISLGKPCLGLITMYIFAVFVYFTAKRKQDAIRYILIGIIILNFVNIIRFVLLFIHLQWFGDYRLTMDIHDIYNYVTYGIVFILWFIWIEKYVRRKDLLKTHSKNQLLT
ncbi:MAG TPA: archaeosortase/exosortase family protein [Bacteroidales bacterium]|nr:archaeosortase/exosortase family protein [Bacteroidales bacterium]